MAEIDLSLSEYGAPASAGATSLPLQTIKRCQPRIHNQLLNQSLVILFGFTLSDDDDIAGLLSVWYMLNGVCRMPFKRLVRCGETPDVLVMVSVVIAVWESFRLPAIPHAQIVVVRSEVGCLKRDHRAAAISEEGLVGSVFHLHPYHLPADRALPVF